MSACAWGGLLLLAAMTALGLSLAAYLWGLNKWAQAPTLTHEELREHLDEVRWKRRYLDGQEERRR